MKKSETCFYCPRKPTFEVSHHPYETNRDVACTSHLYRLVVAMTPIQSSSVVRLLGDINLRQRYVEGITEAPGVLHETRIPTEAEWNRPGINL